MTPTIQPHRPRPKLSAGFTGVPDSCISLDGKHTLEGKSMTRVTSVVGGPKENAHAKNSSRKLAGVPDNEISLDGNNTLEGKPINPKVSSVAVGETAPVEPADTTAAKGIQVKLEIKVTCF